MFVLALASIEIPVSGNIISLTKVHIKQSVNCVCLEMQSQLILYSAANRAAGCLWATLKIKYPKKILFKANMLKFSILNEL